MVRQVTPPRQPCRPGDQHRENTDPASFGPHYRNSPSAHEPVSDFVAEVLGMDCREYDKSIDDEGGRSTWRHRRLTCDKGCVIRIKYGWGLREKEDRVERTSCYCRGARVEGRITPRVANVAHHPM